MCVHFKPISFLYQWRYMRWLVNPPSSFPRPNRHLRKACAATLSSSPTTIIPCFPNVSAVVGDETMVHYASASQLQKWRGIEIGQYQQLYIARKDGVRRWQRINLLGDGGLILHPRSIEPSIGSESIQRRGGSKLRALATVNQNVGWGGERLGWVCGCCVKNCERGLLPFVVAIHEPKINLTGKVHSAEECLVIRKSKKLHSSKLSYSLQSNTIGIA